MELLNRFVIWLIQHLTEKLIKIVPPYFLQIHLEIFLIPIRKVGYFSQLPKITYQSWKSNCYSIYEPISISQVLQHDPGLPCTRHRWFQMTPMTPLQCFDGSRNQDRGISGINRFKEEQNARQERRKIVWEANLQTPELEKRRMCFRCRRTDCSAVCDLEECGTGKKQS